MEAQKTMRFSDMRLDEASIKFEKEQLGLYIDLVNRHPNNESYKRTQLRLTEMLADHEKQLAANTETETL